ETAGAAIRLEKVNPITDQAACLSIFSEPRRWEPLLYRKISNRSCVADKYRVFQHYDRIDAALGHRRERIRNFTRPGHLNSLQPYTQGFGWSLKLLKSGPEKGVVRFHRDRHLADAWCDLLEHFDPFRREFRKEIGHSGEVPAWPREARDDARGNGVTAVHHDDWNRRCRTLGHERPRCPLGHENVNLQTNQLSRQTRELIVLVLGPAKLNGDVLAFDIAQVTKTRPKYLNPARPGGSECRA